MSEYVVGVQRGPGRGASPAAAPELGLVGGKALNLIRLAGAGFAVPDAYVVTTTGYRRFTADNGLDGLIESLLSATDLSEATELERISLLLRSRFRQGAMAADLRRQIVSSWQELVDGEPSRAVAVRSSATAEDLPGLSFAGQQDSYLNVIGADQVCRQTVECWSSLWTARAIGYRQAHGIDHLDAALAVVVQLLIPADASGVLFTANPVTGVRHETVVDATAGLGEALVSGQVEPDHVVLDRAGAVLHSSVGGKAVRTRPLPGGGVETVTVASVDSVHPVLTAELLPELGALARRVEAEFGTPQDVEWALQGDRLWVLQARPITTLIDVPVSYAEAAGRPAAPGLAVWLSFGAVQGVLGPITPLGRDLLAHVAAGATALAGRPRRVEQLTFFGVAHERLFIRIDGPLRHPLGRRAALVLLGIAEPGSVEQLREVAEDPRLRPVRTARVATALRALWTTGRAVSFLGPRVARTMLRPERALAVFDATVAGLLQAARRREEAAARIGDPYWRLHARVTAARAGAHSGLRTLLPVFAPIAPPCFALVGLLGRMTADVPGAQDLPLRLLKGLPGNVTTEMDLRLWQVAVAIRTAGERDELLGYGPAELTVRYRDGELPPVATAEVTRFLEVYGVRGVAEIDVGRPRWREDPSGVFASLRSYLQVEDPDRAPDAVFVRGAHEAATAADRLAELAGPVRRPLVGLATRRIRRLLGIRETPKFTLVSVLGLIRAGLLDSAADLVRDGVLDETTDIAWLTLSELDDPGARAGLRGLIEERREQNAREQGRRAVPRVICGDGLTIFGGARPAPGSRTAGTSRSVDGVRGARSLSGSGVSPGVVEGTVRVVLEPQHAALLPGEVLVCPGTDPAWTPLFLVAAGLVTEVGGMMTHGSVVAREYGIPAVVGMPDATTVLRSGQRVRLDGGAGTVTVLTD